MECGEPFVTTRGTTLMLVWSAGSLDSLPMVRMPVMRQSSVISSSMDPWM